MADFPAAFEAAFHHAMIWEVGPFWNPNDPDVIAGHIATREQRRKVGYVNSPVDRGGETKYGLAQNMNPDLVVVDLNLERSMNAYLNKYWYSCKAHQLLYPLSLLHFDGAVNHGVSRAAKFLQTALGVAADGDIGRVTLSSALSADQALIINRVRDLRRTFYHKIVQNDPSQATHLAGWQRRITEVSDFSLQALGAVS